MSHGLQRKSRFKRLFHSASAVNIPEAATEDYRRVRAPITPYST